MLPGKFWKLEPGNEALIFSTSFDYFVEFGNLKANKNVSLAKKQFNMRGKVRW